MDKRYQVFVSSTYRDLISERVEVIQALLELDCIPSGMEYFPAADETQWDFIKKLIDESDYYIVIIAGMYGSEDEKGISYTQKEYEYAISKGIPTIAFLHENPGSIIAAKTEKDSIKASKLENFKEIVKKKLCKFWSTPQELGAVVSRSISQAKKNYPRTGWVRADLLTETSEKEVLQLYKKIEILEKQLQESSQFHQKEIENLAEGDENLQLILDLTSGPYNAPKHERISLISTWDIISYHLLPKLIDPIRETYFKSVLNAISREIYLNQNINNKLIGNMSLIVSNDSLETVKIQFQLLDLIKIYDESINTNQSRTVKFITLTQKGKEKLISLRAVTKKNNDVFNDVF